MNPLADKLLFVVIGIVLGYVVQQYRAARSEQAALINEHIKDLEKFADATQTYWLKKPSDVDEEKMLSAKVRSAHAVFSLPYETIAALCERHGDKYRQLASELYKCATGGDYERVPRTIDPVRAIDAMTIAANAIMLLRLVRAELISVRRTFQWIWK